MSIALRLIELQFNHAHNCEIYLFKQKTFLIGNQVGS